MSGRNENKGEFTSVALSGGKDSTCALLLMIEKGMPKGKSDTNSADILAYLKAE